MRSATTKRIALVGVACLIVAAVAVAFFIVRAHRYDGALVPTVSGSTLPSDPTGATTRTTGILVAARMGSRVCFWVSPTNSTDDGDRMLLEFTDGYAATEDMALVDASRMVVAAPGDAVTVTGPSSFLSGLLGSIQGCPVHSGEFPVQAIRRGSTP